MTEPFRNNRRCTCCRPLHPIAAALRCTLLTQAGRPSFACTVLVPPRHGWLHTSPASPRRHHRCTTPRQSRRQEALVLPVLPVKHKWCVGKRGWGLGQPDNHRHSAWPHRQRSVCLRYSRRGVVPSLHFLVCRNGTSLVDGPCRGRGSGPPWSTRLLSDAPRGARGPSGLEGPSLPLSVSQNHRGLQPASSPGPASGSLWAPPRTPNLLPPRPRSTTFWREIPALPSSCPCGLAAGRRRAILAARHFRLRK